MRGQARGPEVQINFLGFTAASRHSFQFPGRKSVNTSTRATLSSHQRLYHAAVLMDTTTNFKENQRMATEASAHTSRNKQKEFCKKSNSKCMQKWETN